MDEMVLKTQQWVNETYGNNPKYEKIKENGKTGWSTMYALTRALQIELGITTPVDNFGAGTLAKLEKMGPISEESDTKENIVRIIQGGMYCKGYGTGGITGTYGASTTRAVVELQEDMGLTGTDVDGKVSPKVFKAILTMDAYVLISGGSTKVRTIQQWLNRKYYHRENFFFQPCDGHYSRNTQKALVYAIQYEEGLTDSIANGNFGPSTQKKLPILSLGDSDGGTSFVHLFQAAMVFNGYNVPFDGVFSSTFSNKVKEFQTFANLPITGKGDFSTWASLLVSTGDPNRKGKACDCSTEVTPSRAQALKNEGYETVGRYLTNVDGGLNKKLQSGELENIFNAGLTVFPIYQTYGNKASYFNEEQGKKDAQTAYEAAKMYGFKSGKNGTTIYFAVDFDAYGTDITNNIIPHFRAINEQMIKLGGSYKVGVYGARNVCIQVSDKGLASTSFVSGMSTGFSGNLGYPLPKNWAFDQISTVGIGSNDGFIEIDNNIKSGRDDGVSEIGTAKGINEESFNQLAQIQLLALQYSKGNEFAANYNTTSYYRRKAYRGGIWNIASGEFDTEFESYVNKAIGDNEFIDIMDPMSKENIDVDHMIATISALLYARGQYPFVGVHIQDLAGWGGDLFTVTADVFEYRDQYEGDLYERTYQAAYEYIGKRLENPNESANFRYEDFLGDIDAINIGYELREDYTKMILPVVKDYYQEGAGVSTRYTQFFKKKFNSDEETLRSNARDVLVGIQPDLIAAREILRKTEIKKEYPYYSEQEGLIIAEAFVDKILDLVKKESN